MFHLFLFFAMQVSNPSQCDLCSSKLILVCTALSSHDLIFGGFAFTILSYLLSRQFPETGSLGSCIPSALIRLGASSAILESIGFATSGASNEFIDENYRAVAIYRLVLLIKMTSW